jgi:predicted TIM-barrel fold metal-dependent hydrolase
VIDAYCHCGVSKYLPLPAVQDVLRRAGVERAVLVQHLGEYDNGYLESVAREHGASFRAVALVDPERPGWPGALDAVAASGAFAGLRLTGEMLARRPELARRAADRGLVLVLELPEGVGPSVPAIRALGESGASVVISHLGYPRPDGGELLELADVPSVHALLTEYPHRRLLPFTIDALEAFGPERVLWGSNFPVCGGADEYVENLVYLRTGGYGLSPDEVRAVTHANAERLWFA